MKKSLGKALVIAALCSMALAGCSNSADSSAETENTNTAGENTVVSENENEPLNFNLKITDAKIDGNELSIMYLVSLPSNDRPAEDMEFEKLEIISPDGNAVDCEFDGTELYSANGQDNVYTMDTMKEKHSPQLSKESGQGAVWLEAIKHRQSLMFLVKR